MANVSGAVRTDNLTNLFEDLSEQIAMIGWSDARLLARIRTVDEATQLKHEWQEDEYIPTSDTLAAARASATLRMTLTSAYRFRKFEVCRLAGTVVRIATISATTGKTVWVTSIGGTTLSTAKHTAGTPLIGLQVGSIEGADPQSGIQSVPSKPYNYVETFEDKLVMSDQRKAALGPGSPEWTRQWQKKLKEHAQRMENAVLYGYAQAPTATVPALLGGLWDFITTNLKKVVSDTGCSLTSALTEIAFETLMGQAFEYGNGPNLIVCNVTGMKALNTWYRSYYKIETRSEGSIGVNVTSVKTSFGDLEILLDPLLKNPTTAKKYTQMAKAPGVILGLNMTQLGKSLLREEGSTRRMPLARTGSSQNDMLRTIMTLEKKTQKAHFLIRNFAKGG